MAVLSCEAVRIDLLSGEKQHELTKFVWPWKILIGRAVLMSQRMAVLSHEAVRTDVPSAEKQHE